MEDLSGAGTIGGGRLWATHRAVQKPAQGGAQLTGRLHEGVVVPGVRGEALVHKHPVQSIVRPGGGAACIVRRKAVAVRVVVRRRPLRAEVVPRQVEQFPPDLDRRQAEEVLRGPRPDLGQGAVQP